MLYLRFLDPETILECQPNIITFFYLPIDYLYLS